MLELADRAIEAGTESGFRPLVAYGLLLAGLALLDVDDPVRAEGPFSAGVEAAAGGPAEVLEEACLSGLGATRLTAGDVPGAARRAFQAVGLRSGSSPFCVALRAWEVGALALGGRRAEAGADLAALVRAVGQFEGGPRVVRQGRAVLAATDLREVLGILWAGGNPRSPTLAGARRPARPLELSQTEEPQGIAVGDRPELCDARHGHPGGPWRHRLA